MTEIQKVMNFIKKGVDMGKRGDDMGLQEWSKGKFVDLKSKCKKNYASSNKNTFKIHV